MTQINLLQIVALSYLISQGKKVARLKSNRNLDDKIIDKKMKSMRECGMLQSGVMFDAVGVINAGYEVVDFESGEEVTGDNAANYVVLADANHRYAAHLKLQKEEGYDKEFYLNYPLSADVDIAKMLAEINIATNPWKGGDYGKGAKMLNKDKDLPLLDAINELTDKGYSLDAASKWLTFKPLSSTVLANAMNGVIDRKLENTSGLERGKRLLSAAGKVLGTDVLGKRTMPDWVIGKYEEADDTNKAKVVDNIISFFNSLNRKQIEPIEKAKGTKGKYTKEDVIYNKLNDLFSSYLTKA